MEIQVSKLANYKWYDLECWQTLPWESTEHSSVVLCDKIYGGARLNKIKLLVRHHNIFYNSVLL